MSTEAYVSLLKAMEAEEVLDMLFAENEGTFENFDFVIGSGFGKLFGKE